MSAADELHVVRLPLGSDIVQHVAELRRLAGDYHDLEAFVVLEMGMHLGLDRSFVLRLETDHPRVVVVPADYDQDSFNDAFEDLLLPDVRERRVKRGADRFGPPAEPVCLLYLLESLKIVVVQRYADYPQRLTFINIGAYRIALLLTHW